MQHTALIHIGGGQTRNPLFSRTLHLTRAPATATTAVGAACEQPPGVKESGSSFES
jgi:hypothetical protein